MLVSDFRFIQHGSSELVLNIKEITHIDGQPILSSSHPECWNLNIYFKNTTSINIELTLPEYEILLHYLNNEWKIVHKKELEKNGISWKRLK